MALNPNTKPTTPGTFNGEIRNGWSWVAAANMWLDFSGINIGSTNVVNNLANSGTTTLGLGSPVGLPDYSIKLDTLQEALANNPNKNPFNINVNAGFGNGPEFRNLNTNQLNTLLTNVQPDNVVKQLSYKLITVVVSKSPNRGALYFNNVEDTRSVLPIQTKNIPPSGHKFELKEGNKTHPDIYTIRTNSNVQSIMPMEPTVSLYKNGQVISTIKQSDSGPSTFSIQWDTSLWETPKSIPAEEQPVRNEYKIEVFPDSGQVADLIKYNFDDQTGPVPNDTLISFGPGNFSIEPINDQIAREWNFEYVLRKNGSKIDTSTASKKSYKLQPNVTYAVIVKASKAPIDNTPPPSFGKPILSTSSNVVSFNLASKRTSLSYSTSNATRVIYTLGNTTRELPANGTLSLTSSDFSKVGQFELYLQPIGNGGSGDVKKVIVNVSNKTSIAGPDITHITYPENIIGEDFKGYDIDFKISWASVNADWVDVWVGKVSNSTKLYTKRDPQGQLTLNIKDVLTKAGNNLSEDVDVVDFKLLLSPFNDRGDSTFQGKVEEITIRFDKGNLKLRRGDVVRDIREVIAKQFDTSILKKEDSKYLTHLLHLGEGDNKLISTWGVDTETFSEYKVVDPLTGREQKTKEVKTLVLKLYEPLGGEIQPNQQVWLSKVQSIPLIEQVTVIEDSVEECISLQPNFNEKFTDDIGLKIYDDLIASGSSTSATLVNQFSSGSGFNLKELDIQFVSSSTTLIEFDNGSIISSSGETDYYWSNFVKYSSAEERVENYVYKINLIDNYLDRIDIVTSGSHHTGSITLQNEKSRLENNINEIKVGFDAFEDYLYVNEITSSTESGYSNWYGGIISSARTYDRNNSSRITYNLPKHITDDSHNEEFILFFDMIGNHFDNIWIYTKKLADSRKLEHSYKSGTIDKFIYQMLESLGWDADMGVQSQALWEYAFGTYKDGTETSSMSGKDTQNEIWRRILNNLPYLLKHKGTKRALHALMSCYGIPSSMLTVMEFGGPRDVTSSGTTKFTYDDRTASINISGSSSITIPWKEYSVTSDYPNSFEIRVTSEERQDQEIVSGSGWSLHLLKDTGSLAKVELKVLEGSTFVSQSTDPFPFYNDEYTTIVVNKSVVEGDDTFEIFAKEGFQERIRNESYGSLIVNGTSGWKDGSEIKVGGETLNGSIDEIRLWTTPLEDSVIENHTLLPDAINGNHNSASSEDLIFRNDFEYPKNRGIDFDIKNVAIVQSYTLSSTASGFESISTYPYNYTPYERTVTAQVPQSGFNYSNKVRFEEQKNLDGSDITEDGIGLSYRERSTQKSYDQSPIDSDRLGLFFSPIKEINMDILRSVGPINVDDFIGNPSDDYKDSYSDLTKFREYYFQRYNLNFNEYIQLVRYIDRTLFDQLESLVPARAKVAKGLLIEPHILERSKTQWKRPEGEENYHETTIDTSENTILTTEQNTFLSLISASEDTKLSTEQPFYDGYIDTEELSIVSTSIDNFEGTYVTTDTSNQSGVITRNSGSTMGGFEIDIDARITASLSSFYDSTDFTQVGGFGPDDLAVAGFGLYGSGSYSIRTRLDGNGNIIKDRVKVFKVKESYQDTERVQVSGYPTGSGLVTYEVRNVTRYNDFVTILPWDGADIVEGGDIVEATPLNGHFSTHYRNVEDLTTGLENSYFNGAKQTQQTTLDGGPAWEIFTTNPNTLRVSDSGRGSGEPILEVD